MQTKRLVAIGLAVAALGLVACRAGDSTATSDGERRFVVTGVVVAGAQGAILPVAHDAIPGYMPAMTMPFTLANPEEGARLSAGDRVRFTLRVGRESSRAEGVVATGRDVRAANANSPGVPSASARLRPGDAVPAFHLIDQTGAAISIEDLRGHPTVLTFVFTRCPLPEFCPRIAGHFEQLQRAIAADRSLADVRLLSVTLDPGFDSPQVLTEYGRGIGADFTRWRFATGSPDQVTVLTRAFAVHTERSGALLDHTLATALIDGPGEVVELWRGNQWTVQEVVDALHQRSGSK